LALMNDISMIPVAYDNAVASKSPQIPKTGRIVLEAVLVGFVRERAGCCTVGCYMLVINILKSRRVFLV